MIETGDFIGAAKKIKETNALPAVCGRVCPQEEQCEVKCVLAKKGDPVAIGRLERFAADYERNAGKVEVPKIAVSTGKKIAVVGSGPAGLTVAGTLRLLGHDVTVFEALHKTGRSARLRYPRVPSAEGDRRGRGRTISRRWG